MDNCEIHGTLSLKGGVSLTDAERIVNTVNKLLASTVVDDDELKVKLQQRIIVISGKAYGYAEDYIALLGGIVNPGAVEVGWECNDGSEVKPYDVWIGEPIPVIDAKIEELRKEIQRLELLRVSEAKPAGTIEGSSVDSLIKAIERTGVSRSSIKTQTDANGHWRVYLK